MPESLAELLAEPVAAAKQREALTFDELAANRPLIFFGAGGLGRRTVKYGIKPLMFCDNNPALWGNVIDGVPVVSVPEAVARYGKEGAFVITIWNAAERMADRLQALRAAGCETVLHFGEFYWRHLEMLPYYAANAPHRVLERRDAVLTCANLWTDEASRQEYLAQVRWRLHYDFAGLPKPAEGPIYFRFPLQDDEVFVDCGAFDGDTIRSFLAHTGGRFKKAYAFEPDPYNFARIRLEDPRIVLKQAAVGRANGCVRFSAQGNEASTAGQGDLLVDCLSLDSYLADEKPTFLKMDIEGFEPEALAGAREIIARHSPALAICVYHAQEHLWEIPLQIHSYNPNYDFYLRPHLNDVWDLVCYAIPHHAVRPPSTDSTAPVI